MSDEQRPPPERYVGSHAAVPDYAAGVASRSAERAAARVPVMPNLGQAAVAYRASDGAQTLEEIARTQRADAGAPADAGARGLRPETVEGLRALHAEQSAVEARRAEVPPPAPPPEAAAPKGDDKQLTEDDLEFIDALRNARVDAIQNDREREAVAKRVEPIDLSEGLLSGEFTQLVPVVPGKLNVRYRCLTPSENNELRMLVLDQVIEDKRREVLTAEMLSFYQTIATIVSINQTTYPRHMVADGAFGRLTFNHKMFEQKVATFSAFPLPLIASLSTHAGWFEMRVRELFVTAEAIKNG